YQYSWFFFSSRRRHTRFKCDWSSDVCSSDLWDFSPFVRVEQRKVPLSHPENDAPHPHYGPIMVYKRKHFSPAEVRTIWRQSGGKIGRASCREREEMSVGAGGVKGKK